VHIGNVGAKGGQKFVAAAWIGGYDGDYADHLLLSLFSPGSRAAVRR
jgi:hypothetical protein